MKFSPNVRGRLQHLSAATLIALVFIAGFALGSGRAATQAQSQTDPPPEAKRAFEPFWQVYNLIQSDYIDPVTMDELVDGAISGMVDALGDQYSGYMNPEVFDLLNSDLGGEIQGIGVVIHTNEETNQIEVVGVLESAVRVGRPRPGHVLGAGDVPAAQRAFLRIVGHVQQLAAVLAG